MLCDAPVLSAGFRLYVIGDIHGRADLLRLLLDKINHDRTGHASRLIFLGDYIDRGLYSRDVIELLLSLQRTEREAPVFILGNHEQVLREILHAPDIKLFTDWLRFGGRETLNSYGIEPPGMDPAASLRSLRHAFPAPHLNFLDHLQSCAVFGDYFFCHAGVRPGIPLYAQSERDLTWIRQEFLQYNGPYEKIIVHGHTISIQPEILSHRINIDTGAYATGHLTALVIEGNEKWLLNTA